MIILALDSSTDTFSAFLTKDGAVVGEFCYQRPRGQLIHLLPSILEMMRITGISPLEVELTGVTTGPGSFTGLRLGIITATTIAQLLNCSIVPVNTLDAIAMNVSPSHRTICSMLDARRNEIFAAFYTHEKGRLHRITGYLTFTLKSLTAYLEQEKGDFTLTGNALSRYGSRLQELGSKVHVLSSPFWYPGATGMYTLITDSYREGHAASFYDIKPFYMRKSDAEEKLEKNRT